MRDRIFSVMLMSSDVRPILDRVIREALVVRTLRAHRQVCSKEFD